MNDIKIQWKVTERKQIKGPLALEGQCSTSNLLQSFTSNLFSTTAKVLTVFFEERPNAN